MNVVFAVGGRLVILGAGGCGRRRLGQGLKSFP